MSVRETIAEAETPDGELLTLAREDGEHVVRVRGEVLMSSRVHGSEEAMARLALADRELPDRPRVLVAGLGMGFTLRAALELLGPHAEVTVVELLEAVVRWNHGPLADYAERPLEDPRVTLTVGDLRGLLRVRAQRFDAILIDVDNGPEPFTVRSNATLYAPEGLARLYDALAPGGVAVLWSAFRSTAFERRLRDAGFEARTVSVRARAKARKGARHTLFVATRKPDD